MVIQHLLLKVPILWYSKYSWLDLLMYGQINAGQHGVRLSPVIATTIVSISRAQVKYVS